MLEIVLFARTEYQFNVGVANKGNMSIPPLKTISNQMSYMTTIAMLRGLKQCNSYNEIVIVQYYNTLWKLLNILQNNVDNDKVVCNNGTK